MKSGLWMLGVLPVFITAASGVGSTWPTEARDGSFVVGESPRS